MTRTTRLGLGVIAFVFFVAIVIGLDVPFSDRQTLFEILLVGIILLVLSSGGRRDS